MLGSAQILCLQARPGQDLSLKSRSNKHASLSKPDSVLSSQLSWCKMPFSMTRALPAAQSSVEETSSLGI